MRWVALVLLWSSAAFAFSPLEKNLDAVDEGMQAYEQGDFERALEAFDRAQKEKGTDPRVAYNRGLALHKLGRADEAKQAFTRALELDRSGEYESKIRYNLGTIAAAANQREEAVRELRRALKKDPSDALARHNLEVVLRDLPPKDNKTGQDGGSPDGGKADGGRPDAGSDGGTSDGGSDAGSTDGGAKDGGEGDGGSSGDAGTDGGTPQDGGQGDGGRGDGGQGDQDTPGDGGADGGQGDQGASSDGGTADGGEERFADGGAGVEMMGLPDGGMSKEDAEKLLEPLKRNEKNLQLWRFRQKTQKNDPNGKDW